MCKRLPAVRVRAVDHAKKKNKENRLGTLPISYALYPYQHHLYLLEVINTFRATVAHDVSSLAILYGLVDVASARLQLAMWYGDPETKVKTSRLFICLYYF